MSGNLRLLRPGVWEARIDAGRDPVTQRRRQISRSVKGSKREAQKVLNEMASEADRGRFTGTSATFGELCDGWLALAKPGLSPVTIRNYENLLKNHIIPTFGDVALKNIQTIDIDKYYSALQSRHGVTPSTIRHIHSVIRRAFRQAVLWDWVTTNPVVNVTQPPLVKPDLSPPDPEQVTAILKSANGRDPELGHLLHLAATTGARRGELCALRWSNVDFDLGTLTIERSIIEVGGGVIEKDTKTHASRRIKLDQDTLDVLEAQRRLAHERASVIGIEVDADAYVFSREPDGSTPWRPDRVTKEFAAIRDSLGYLDVRLHDLRHFVATRLIAEGVAVRTVSGRLGHANASTTLSVYSHFIEASDQDAALVMGRIVGDGGTTRKSTPKRTKKAATKVTSKSAVKKVPARSTAIKPSTTKVIESGRGRKSVDAGTRLNGDAS
jgi:integrase